MTEKFKIILGDAEYMRSQYPLAKQHRVAAESKGPVLFVESPEAVDFPDVAALVNEWNQENIEEILVEGKIAAQLAFALSLGNWDEQGVTVRRGQTASDVPDSEEFGYYM